MQSKELRVIKSLLIINDNIEYASVETGVSDHELQRRSIAFHSSDCETETDLKLRRFDETRSEETLKLKSLE